MTDDPGQVRTSRRRDRHGGATATQIVGVIAAGVLVLMVLRALDATGIGGRPLVVLLDNGVQLAAAVAAMSACARVALSDGRESRSGWVLLTAGSACWVLGQAVWTYLELVLGQDVPFPSFADMGFLLFPLLTSAGLLSWLRAGDTASARVRDLLDGAVIACSVFVLSWVTTLEELVRSHDGGSVPLALSIAYPLGDVVMATVVVLALNRVRSERTTLTIVALGLAGLTIADSAYFYLVVSGEYRTGDVISAGWVVGFGLIAVGARRALTGRSTAIERDRATGPLTGADVPSRSVVGLPYIPLALAGSATVGALLRVPGAASIELGLGVVLIALVFGRQLVVLAENRRLLTALRQAQDQLQTQALHDDLTGLPNRILFADRLEHALGSQDRCDASEERDHGRAPIAVPDVAVLFCDLNLFKEVNDTWGHATGDELLRAAASRIRALLRPHDTVARLGGDEFAVLVEGSSDPMALAQRLVDAVEEPFVLHGCQVQVSMSVGVARAGDLPGNPLAATAHDLLRGADSAMYSAKRRGAAGGAAELWRLPAHQPAAPAG
jgi:diguanylate cyclase